MPFEERKNEIINFIKLLKLEEKQNIEKLMDSIINENKEAFKSLN